MVLGVLPNQNLNALPLQLPTNYFIMTSNYFTYEKGKVIQALRYHFISKKEIKTLMILVNVFAILSAILYFNKIVSPFAFLIGTLLWFGLMTTFWFLMPFLIFKRTQTFKDQFRVIFSADDFTLQNDQGERSWEWKDISHFLESPHFFHVYFSSTSFFIIPKDAFPGETVHTARKYFQEHIK